VCTWCQAWPSNELYLDFNIYGFNHMLNAQVLAVWTLCQAWAYEPATDSIIDTFFDPSM
jgi:hypothetical protein